ncbi:hypothetical protein SAMN04487818_11735 [Actinokineospora terrae]|uniref:PH domain-containing protein n=2 Tax=Actinokineospora terrae TaxID=155974 RepID=A0A1H9XMA3_9PSEU|nr:hypothetical protein SAMN04487818_11735 [Actinokineospora terrae]
MVFAGVGGVVALGVAAKASRGGYDGLAAAAGVIAVLLGLSAARSLWRVLVTRPRSVVVTAAGLAISAKDGDRVLAWPEISRVRVVTEDSKPWLVVWPHTPDRTLGKRHTRREGGFRVHPVSHHHGKRRQTQDIQNLRTALHRHAGKAYDPTP